MDSSTLITISKTTHARHNTKNVVVRRVDTDRRARRRSNGVVGDREKERRVINARQVARA